MGGSGAVYIGVNVEFPRSALNNSVGSMHPRLPEASMRSISDRDVLPCMQQPCWACDDGRTTPHHATVYTLHGVVNAESGRKEGERERRALEICPSPSPPPPCKHAHTDM